MSSTACLEVWKKSWHENSPNEQSSAISKHKIHNSCTQSKLLHNYVTILFLNLSVHLSTWWVFRWRYIVIAKWSMNVATNNRSLVCLKQKRSTLQTCAAISLISKHFPQVYLLSWIDKCHFFLSLCGDTYRVVAPLQWIQPTLQLQVTKLKHRIS